MNVMAKPAEIEFEYWVSENGNLIGVAVNCPGVIAQAKTLEDLNGLISLSYRAMREAEEKERLIASSKGIFVDAKSQETVKERKRGRALVYGYCSIA